MSEELETAAAEVVLGIDVENFLETSVGRYILGCSEQDEADAIGNLLNIDPYKSATLGELQSAISKAQNDVLIGRKVQGYLTDAIIRGNQAEEVLQNEEE